jgi:hypothetical protein
VGHLPFFEFSVNVCPVARQKGLIMTDETCLAALEDFRRELGRYLGLVDSLDYSDSDFAGYDCVDDKHPLKVAAVRVEDTCFEGQPLPSPWNRLWGEFLRQTRRVDDNETDRSNRIWDLGTQLLAWVEERAGHQPDAGPHPPCWFFWDSKRYKVVGMRFKLLQYLWSSPERKRPKIDVGSHLWGEEWDDSKLRTTMNRMNNDLASTPWRARIEDEDVLLEERPS